MSDNSAIEWTRGDDGTPGATWNPILGCSRVSPGCDACYAINSATIRAGNPHPRVAAAFAGLTERRDGRLDWTGRVNLLPERLTQPLKWRKPKRIFVNSLADLFHDDVPLSFIEQVFAVMSAAPQHTFQLLTKRHARMASILRRPTFRDSVAARRADLAATYRLTTPFEWPIPGLWLGVSVENQQWTDIRIPALLDTPAAVRFLSCEPLLGPVDLRPHFGTDHLRHMIDGGWHDDCRFCLRRREEGGTGVPPLHWVIVGGESGPGARPMHPDWARQLRNQCSAAGVPFFFKQWGQFRPGGDAAIPASYVTPDGTIDRTGYGPVLPGHAAMVRVGKKAAGRELDGRTWDEYPQPRAEAVA